MSLYAPTQKFPRIAILGTAQCPTGCCLDKRLGVFGIGEVKPLHPLQAEDRKLAPVCPAIEQKVDTDLIAFIHGEDTRCKGCLSCICALNEREESEGSFQYQGRAVQDRTGQDRGSHRRGLSSNGTETYAKAESFLQ